MSGATLDRNDLADLLERIAKELRENSKPLPTSLRIMGTNAGLP